MMKKTTVALALAATMVTGSAMAWTAGGPGGSFEFGGTLTPPPSANPWEVMVGSATVLDSAIKPGDKSVDIPVTKPITALGIRTTTNAPFAGQMGISPQIDYSNMLGATWDKGYTDMVLDVKNDQGAKIGTLKTRVLAAAVSSNHFTQQALYASDPGMAFYGGLSSSSNQVIDSVSKAISLLNQVNPEIIAKYNSQSDNDTLGAAFEKFSSPTDTYSGFYGSGIPMNSNMKLELDTAAGNTTISWKASMPVTVFYQ
ncbi:hypothetical protein GUO17_004046 [Salmonella enterica]|nr:hypothetical protein [Salmonella enterica]EAT6281942.1 hypothetical protein [Salmonella enterica]EBA8767053.1 hypothetical protein [Salmonella enterica]EDY2585952.1 hypothetical protein [Salmonella enterica]EGC4450267.1 hypothetical protein [Salmonella enterica]